MKLGIIHTVTMILLVAGSRLTAAEGTNSTPTRPAPTNATGRLDVSSFQNISLHNIFDPNRRGIVPVTSYVRSVRVDSFSLRGTMIYPSQSVAFFDGSSSLYNKAVTTQGTIAGYKIAEIAFDHVKLAAASNQTVNLPVGSQMKRRDNGPWSLEEGSEPSADSNPPAATEKPAKAGEKPPGTGATSGADSDVIKRLMKKHEEDN